MQEQYACDLLLFLLEWFMRAHENKILTVNPLEVMVLQVKITGIAQFRILQMVL